MVVEREKRIDEILLEKEILRENIEKLKLDVENEQKRQIEKKELFVEDLDAQVEEKETLSRKAKDDPKKTDKLRVEMLWDDRVRERNELAKKLSKWSFEPTDNIMIGVKYIKFNQNGRINQKKKLPRIKVYIIYQIFILQNRIFVEEERNGIRKQIWSDTNNHHK